MRRVLPLLLLLAACGRPGVTLLPEQDLPEDIYGSPVPSPTTTVDLPEKGVVYLVREGRLVRQRLTLPGEGVAESLPAALLLALFTGPPDDRRVHSAIPPGTLLNEVSVEGSLATVDVSGAFEQGAPEDVQALRVAQVVYTLTEPQTGISQVEIYINGEPKLVPGGGGQSLGRPLNRSDYTRFAPQ
jgi:spore germination protein GerM